jgi:hypothetical protein
MLRARTGPRSGGCLMIAHGAFNFGFILNFHPFTWRSRSFSFLLWAMTNPMEYFAESTEAFFARNDFFPS